MSRSRAPSEVAPSWTKEAVFLNEDQFTISENDADVRDSYIIYVTHAVKMRLFCAHGQN